MIRFFISLLFPSTKIGFSFAYAHIIYYNNQPKSGKGIIPDYVVPDTYNSFAENKDEQFNFIIDSLISKKR